MKHASIFLIVLFYFAAHATVYTKTHAYILDTKSGKLLAVNRMTNKEIILDVGQQPTSFQIHKDYGYCVDPNNGVTVVDLAKNTVDRVIKMQCGGDLIIYEDAAFVYDYGNGANSIAVIDLMDWTVDRISIRSIPTQFIRHNDFGYALCSNGDLLEINLKTKTWALNKDHPADTSLMHLHDNKGYFFKTSGLYTVIDLSTQKLSATGTLSTHPFKMLIDNDHGYVLHKGKKYISIIAICDHSALDPQWISQRCKNIYIDNHLLWVLTEAEGIHLYSTIYMNQSQILSIESPSSVMFNEGYAYVACKDNTEYAVVNLSDLTVVQTLENPNRENIHLSDFHIYLGVKRVGKLKSENNLLHKALALGNIEMAAIHVQEAGDGDVPEEAKDINLDLGDLSHLIDSTFNPFDYVYEESSVEEILKDVQNEIDQAGNNLDYFIIGTLNNLPITKADNFKAALRANDPFARAVMYVVFKNGLFGAKGLEIVSLFYKEGAHVKTVQAMEAKFVKGSLDKGMV